MCEFVEMPLAEQQARVNAAKPKVDRVMSAGNERTGREASAQAGRLPGPIR